MAVTLGFGVVFATVITLVLVPAACMAGVEAARFVRAGALGRRRAQPGDGRRDTCRVAPLGVEVP